MSVPEITAHIAGNMAALRTTMPDFPPRHRSIEAALAGSYDLLQPERQHILARFAVLRGGCTVEAAEKVLAAAAEDMALLARRALLYKHEGRYTMHELVRQFAADKLAQMADKVATARAHAEYYLAILNAFENELYGPQPLAAIRQLRPERENIRQAWRWAVENGRY
jgi:hypothetical protein